jgi:hypothetical protein
MTIPADYAIQVRTKLVTCPAINSFSIIEEKLLPESGYIRLRASLLNGDFLEAAEYFALEGDQIVTRRYRYQWMDKERKTLHKRWDNVEHYPDLPNFPHHIHMGEEGNVEPGKPLSIVQLLDVLAGEVISSQTSPA